MAQENLFTDISENLDKGPVICLGKTFNSEEERRAYFRNELRTKLPELKTIEGFPIGEDEDIINLSDPPYYTACPNPWLNDFIDEWEKEKENIKGRNPDFHVNEPYASDVSEGKYSPFYKMHPYHTKVPHIAIMRYILHYTQPGDIVFDGFAGTGMTGVAAQCCESPDEVTKYKLEGDFRSLGLTKPAWGLRKVICGDLSPIASFISYNYNIPCDIETYLRKAQKIIETVKNESCWMFETTHTDGKKGKILSTYWSEVFACPFCGTELIYWDVAVDKMNGIVNDQFTCTNCKAVSTKSTSSKVLVTKNDDLTNEIIRQPKVVPVLIKYKANSKSYDKIPDKGDFELLKKIDEAHFNFWMPSYKMMNKGSGWGDTWRAGVHEGITNVNHFYFKRNLVVLGKIRSLIDDPVLNYLISSVSFRITKRYLLTYQNGTWGAGGGPTSGTMYMPSLIKDLNIIDSIEKNISKRTEIDNSYFKGCSLFTQSSTILNIASNSIDYIFLDPPFGDNLHYSELNFLWESWLKVFTNISKEAIENKSQSKFIIEYKSLLAQCFKEAFRILKPGKWLTIEFSNTRAAIWNVVQTTLGEAGFVIANVSALDKKKGTFISQTNPTSVKQDLVISCYKPSVKFDYTFKKAIGEIAVWDFVQEHFNHLPIHFKKDGNTTAIIERSPKILFDRLITFYLMRGLPVPIDARDFQEGLKQRFIERDGMYFTAEQAAEYDEKKAKIPNFVQLSLIVTNESDAIEWLKERLRKEAQKYQDIMPDFRIATQSLRKGDSLPELQDILNESFIQETDGRWRTPDPNEAKDREALRTKVLLKEFTGYVTAINQAKAKKLKEVRVEALRAGFKNCWEQKDFKTIVTLGDKIPQNILLEDEQLLMYYDIAKDRE
jgi:DNA modification methylase